MKRVALSFLFGFVALLSVSMSTTSVGATNGFTTELGWTAVSELPTEYYYMEDVSTTGTAIWYIVNEGEGVLSFYVDHSHASTTFQTSLSVNIFSDEGLTTSLHYYQGNINMESHADPDYYKTTISGFANDTDYWLQMRTTNPSTSPLYTDTSLVYNLFLENPSLISQILNSVSSMVVGFTAIIIALFSNEGVATIFYSTENGLTILGGLLVITFGLVLVKWSFGWIRRLIQMRG